MKIKLELIANLENIIRESVKPMENIEGIKIIQDQIQNFESYFWDPLEQLRDF